jgi:TonB family protein
MVEEKANKNIREAEAAEKAKLEAEEARRLAELARIEAENEAKKKAQEALALQQAKLEVEEALRLAEMARVTAEEELKRRLQEIEAEREARLRAKQERQRAELTLANAAPSAIHSKLPAELIIERHQSELALLEATKELKLKAKELKAEQQARRKAEQEQKQAQKELLEIREEAEKKALVANEEQQARIAAEQQRQQAELSLRQAEEEAQRRAQEAEAEQQARIAAEQQRQQAELSLRQAEEEAQRRAQEVEAEQWARIRAEEQLRLAEVERQKVNEAARKKTQEAHKPEEPLRSFSFSTRLCPTCMREFSMDQVYCLYDATLLLEPGAKRAKNIPIKKSSFIWPLAIASVLAIVGLAILVVPALSRRLLSLTSPTDDTVFSSTTPVANPAPDSPVVSGALAGKEVTLPNPVYPEAAKRKGLLGKVTVSVLVNRTGTVTWARALNGHPYLQPTAVEAAKKAKFSESKLMDRTGLTSGTITYTFK